MFKLFYLRLPNSKNLIRKAKSHFEFNDGFTLIELLVVVIILGILAGTVIASVGGARTSSINKVCKSDAVNVRQALDNFYIDTNGLYPKTTGTNTYYVTADFTRTDYTIGGKAFNIVPSYMRSPGPSLYGDALGKDYYLQVNVTVAANVVSAVNTIQGYTRNGDGTYTSMGTDCQIQ